jgi:hypothetical protein
MENNFLPNKNYFKQVTVQSLIGFLIIIINNFLHFLFRSKPNHLINVLNTFKVFSFLLRLIIFHQNFCILKLKVFI